MICVVQPPPSAKWGMTAESIDTGAWRSNTGNVVIRKSLRSLVLPRSATAAIGAEELKVKVPVNEEGLLNGGSLRNLAICPLAGIVVAPLPKLPFESVKKKDTVAGSLLGLAMAR